MSLMEPYQLFSDLVHTEVRLYNALDRRLRADHGLAASQHAMLRFIEATDGCRVADIAREMVIAVGAASKSVDRLESSGWVVRRPNPGNRRSSLLELTQSGRSLLAQASATADAEVRHWLGSALTEPELAQLAGALGRVLSTLYSAGIGQPTG
jgi:MarR family multiple antibiotic resistance transcriptional regulator